MRRSPTAVVMSAVIPLLAAMPCQAVNTNGYVVLSEVKAFDGFVLAYLADAQEHQCSSTLEKTSYRLDPAKKHLVALLYLAYAQRGTVLLSYDCAANGLPYLSAVRLRP
jgi:hypothetical protein